MKKKALLSSILTIALCLSLIAGSTFALFTSESKVNVAVTAGKVDVVATIENLELYSPTSISKDGNIIDDKNVATNENFKNGGTATLKENKLTLTNITPGDKVTFDVKITNNSNVTVQYRSIVEEIVDDGLWAGLKVTIGGESYNGVTKKSGWTVLEVGSKDIIVPVVIELPATAGNEYQEKSCELAYTVEAVQGNAQMPDEWDGVAATAPEGLGAINDTTAGEIHIKNAAELVYVMKNTQVANSPYAAKTFILDCDIDFGGATITGIGSDKCNISFTFDGNGHTISNFVINRTSDYYAGLFQQLNGTVKNLTVKDATVIGNKHVGAVCSSVYNNACIENCHAVNCTVIGAEKVGSVAGFVDGGTAKNCSATNCTVYCATNEQSHGLNQWGEVIGFIYGGATVDCATSFTNVTVKTGVSYIANGVMLNNGVYEISNADGLNWFATQVNAKGGEYYTFTGKTAKLVADIDLNNQAWTPIGVNYYGGQFAGTFDGNGHTIKNLNVTANDADDTGYYGTGLFGWNNGTVKNLIIDGAKVSGYGFVGTIAGYMERGTITDCTVKNATVVATHKSTNCCGDKAGAVVGYLNPGNCTITNNAAVDCTVKAARDAGQIIGCAYTSNTVTGNTATNVTVSANTTGCTDDDAGKNINNAIVGRTINS